MTRMLLLSLPLALLASCAGTGQTSPNAIARTTLAAEIQTYPTGVIYGVRHELPVSDSDVVILRASYNRADRHEFGEHEDEDGRGWGGGLGYRHYVPRGESAWFLGGRVDLWDLEVDWVDGEGSATQTRGVTDTLVVQPAIEAGYRFFLGASGFAVDASVALGVEINTDTEGEDVGEGAIGLFGLSLVHLF